MDVIDTVIKLNIFIISKRFLKVFDKWLKQVASAKCFFANLTKAT